MNYLGKLFVAAILTGLTAGASAHNYSGLYIFGDSLSTREILLWLLAPILIKGALNNQPQHQKERQLKESADAS